MDQAEPLVVDIHTHAFPRLGTASGGESASFHTRCIQHHVQYSYQGIRRAADDMRVSQPLLVPEGEGIDIDGGVHRLQQANQRFPRLAK